ncbi:MAG: dihydroorotase [Tissierellia bacterium]|nr:dihydroorotase [Tissierellia bacterium]
MKTLIKNAKLILKDNETDIFDILIEDGKILKIEKEIPAEETIEKTYDAKSMLTLAGGIDVHVHLRQPGFETKETIKTGTMAALRGGYTSLMPMPNLKPNPDSVDHIEKYMQIIEKDALVNVFPTACITEKSQGRKLVDMKAIKDRFGINAFTDDGVGLQDEKVMQAAMEMAKKQDGIIVAHTEDMSYRRPNSSVHDGEFARANAWIGIPSETEYKQVERDLDLAYKTGAKYHICHMSAKESVEALRKYKKMGADVSGEVTCHHLLLVDEDVKDTNYKMNPPLRTKEDRKALIEGLLDGTIDFIANDHAPHTKEEKERSMAKAPFGIVGIETAIPLIYTNFVKKGIFSLEDLQKFIAQKPAQRFGLKNKGQLRPGYDADIIIISDEKVKIRKEDFLSKGKNTPFEGYEVMGYPVYTFVNGICKFEKGIVND